MKKIATFAVAVLLAIAAYYVGRQNNKAQLREICWGDVLMENYVLDVVDETDFWEVCDSTHFNCHPEYTSEWYLAVCLEFARLYK